MCHILCIELLKNIENSVVLYHWIVLALFTKCPLYQMPSICIATYFLATPNNFKSKNTNSNIWILDYLFYTFLKDPRTFLNFVMSLTFLVNLTCDLVWQNAIGNHLLCNINIMVFSLKIIRIMIIFIIRIELQWPRMTLIIVIRSLEYSRLFSCICFMLCAKFDNQSID